MRKNPSYTALLRPARLLISEKSAAYTIKWSYSIICQVRVNHIPSVNNLQKKIFKCLEKYVHIFDTKFRLIAMYVLHIAKKKRTADASFDCKFLDVVKFDLFRHAA